MDTFSEWLDHYIEKMELNNYSFYLSPSTISAYRNSRTLPKWPDYVTICHRLGLKASRSRYERFKENFTRNEKR